MAREPESDINLSSVFITTGKFAFANNLSLIGISVGWFFASLPILTIGPATLGAYSAICSIRESPDGTVNSEAVVSTVRAKLVESLLLSWIPILLAGISLLYTVEYIRTGSIIYAIMATLCFYATGFVILILIPAFVTLSKGQNMTEALKTGYVWTATHPITAIALCGATILILIFTISLTIAFILLFPALAFSLHIEAIDTGSLDGQNTISR